MPRSFAFFLLALLLALSACQGKATVPAGLTPIVPTFAPTSTLSSAQATQDSGPTATVIPAGCTVVSPVPTSGPTEQSLFPQHMEGDQVRGPEDARITIIEYADFQ